MEEAGSSGKVSLSEKVALALLAAEGSTVKDGWDFATKVGIVDEDSNSCCQGGYGFLK